MKRTSARARHRRFAWLPLVLCAAIAQAAAPAHAPPLEQWRGQPVLLNYWATWCAPCLREMPELDAFAAAQAGKRAVQVVGIALDEPASVQAYLARRPVRYPVLVEAVDYGQAGSSARYGNRLGVLPYSVLLDAQGRVLRSKAGPLTAAELAAWTAAAR
ncbi:TlpA family protein disulfide reductase [Pseudoxanthomonas sp. SGNA-20]|jgi:Thiol-disulfide isomerase and thioredoxins|uniref:Thiol-disulfide isomerase/thioredoxin n=1 Tax=Pseudoxanthomonas taiwanensis J19 TaxID=935569 RepID=A0A562D102_9GAMM|nr:MULTISPECIES: TlpA disulfide reductase family protein [Pseudoxanthomonas]RRN59280.1 TlpA family protein disulfide reductase [Pseudoxanthomonas sp. SGNA-20]TWH03366.1 thiol-disulfide isomerase/thioredoxin [Pseudoxanthomonas taiwanensis J19]